VVIFAVPGAFTPTCSKEHAPGFIRAAADLKAKGVDTIACLSVNDAFVMDAVRLLLLCNRGFRLDTHHTLIPQEEIAPTGLMAPLAGVTLAQ
jgi:Redoxin